MSLVWKPMKINLTPTDLQLKPKSPSRLPGEKHAFIERSIRNLVPPQHLQDGAVVSSRDHEVGSIDPLMQRIRELQHERTRLLTLATKHCPKDHHDWAEILTFKEN